MRLAWLACLPALVACEQRAAERQLPPHIAKYSPMMEEVQRVSACASGELQRRDMDVADTFAMLERRPDASQQRAIVLGLIDRDLQLPAAERARLAQTPGLEAPLMAYVTAGSAMPDPAVATRAAGLLAVHLDRAVGGVCQPSSSLLTHIGAPARAD